MASVVLALGLQLMLLSPGEAYQFSQPSSDFAIAVSLAGWPMP